MSDAKPLSARPADLDWLSLQPCEHQRKYGFSAGTCRSPIKSEGRQRADWCVSCQARQQTEEP